MSATARQLSPVEVAALLRAGAAALQAELSALPEALASWHPAPGEWCVQETLGHLIEAERRGFAGRIAQMLAEAEPRLAGWDPPAVARARQDCARPLAALLAEFTALRSASAALVAGLTPADLARGGHHPEAGYLQAGDLLHEWVHHDRNHLRQMLAAVQAAVWSHMGNARRFSQPDLPAKPGAAAHASARPRPTGAIRPLGICRTRSGGVRGRSRSGSARLGERARLIPGHRPGPPHAVESASPQTTTLCRRH
jgi:hypothetical protein